MSAPSDGGAWGPEESRPVDRAVVTRGPAWRFTARPGSPYTVFASGSEQGEYPSGYIVLKRWQEPDGYRKAHIMDLHASDEAALASLIAAAETYAADCQELNLWSPKGYVYLPLLLELGFRPASAIPPSS